MLILDEPTNHLDIESREALEDALLEFEGAVILVSHDRALLEAVGTRTLVCEDGELRSHPSGWAEYQRERDEREARERERVQAAARPDRPAAGDGRTRSAGPSKNAVRRVATPRTRDRAGRGRAARASRTSSPTPPPGRARARSQRATERHEAASRAVEDLYEQLEEAEGALSPSGPG